MPCGKAPGIRMKPGRPARRYAFRGCWLASPHTAWLPHASAPGTLPLLPFTKARVVARCMLSDASASIRPARILSLPIGCTSTGRDSVHGSACSVKVPSLRCRCRLAGSCTSIMSDVSVGRTTNLPPRTRPFLRFMTWSLCSWYRFSTSRKRFSPAPCDTPGELPCGASAASASSLSVAPTPDASALVPRGAKDARDMQVSSVYSQSRFKGKNWPGCNCGTPARTRRQNAGFRESPAP
mmetsp:Transcript_32725/g.97578  ORF Transcript_32725/g.97578 Transcript_32725/m.97578 type:complete len:238 (-) Transcript_32725:210-923(-)